MHGVAQDAEHVVSRQPLNAEALLSLLRHLRKADYHFVTPTPATHARILSRPGPRLGHSLPDILGWSLPFKPGTIDARAEHLLHQANALESAGATLRSKIRVSCLHGEYFVHSAYPTSSEDAVFFGPDSYRFADLVRDEVGRAPLQPGSRIIDIGTGCGVGAIVASKLVPGSKVFGTDVNPLALVMAEVNARAAGATVKLMEASHLGNAKGPFDLVLANPPYIIDTAGRTYRDGGGMLGGQVSVDMARAALPQLSGKGRFVLYTGSAIVKGHDALRNALKIAAQQQGCRLSYRELDPDVFGEELDEPAYADVERIAAVAAIFTPLQ